MNDLADHQIMFQDPHNPSASSTMGTNLSSAQSARQESVLERKHLDPSRSRSLQSGHPSCFRRGTNEHPNLPPKPVKFDDDIKTHNPEVPSDMAVGSDLDEDPYDPLYELSLDQQNTARQRLDRFLDLEFAKYMRENGHQNFARTEPSRRKLREMQRDRDREASSRYGTSSENEGAREQYEEELDYQLLSLARADAVMTSVASAHSAGGGREEIYLAACKAMQAHAEERGEPWDLPQDGVPLTEESHPSLVRRLSRDAKSLSQVLGFMHDNLLSSMGKAAQESFSEKTGFGRRTRSGRQVSELEEKGVKALKQRLDRLSYQQTHDRAEQDAKCLFGPDEAATQALSIELFSTKLDYDDESAAQLRAILKSSESLDTLIVIGSHGDTSSSMPTSYCMTRGISSKGKDLLKDRPKAGEDEGLTDKMLRELESASTNAVDQEKPTEIQFRVDENVVDALTAMSAETCRLKRGLTMLADMGENRSLAPRNAEERLESSACADPEAEVTRAPQMAGGSQA